MVTVRSLAALPLAGVMSLGVCGWGTAATQNQPTAVQVAQDSSSPVQITDLQVETTAAGLQIVLATTAGELTTPATSVAGNALIVEIPNAVLRLPEGDEFQQFGPAPGIALIAATTLPDNLVQLVITGADAPPLANIDTAGAGIVLRVTPSADGEATAATDDGIRVVVTAERRPEDAQDVPVSLTTFSETQIEDANITSLDSVADRTPNFTFFSSGGNRTAAFYSLRGVTNFNAFSRDAVGFFVDDVPYDFAAFIDQDLVDLERIEVLRGPQNILYGRSSAGGVVNIVTRRPTNDFEFNGAVSYGSFDDFETQLSVSGPIVEDELLFRLSGSYGTQGGFVNNTFLDEDIDGGQSFTGRGQLVWTPTADWEILLNASFGDYREGGAPYVVADDDPFDAEVNINGFNDLVTNAQSLRVRYEAPTLQLTSITTHRFSDQNAAFDQDGSLADLLINAPDFSSRVFSQELRLQSPDDQERFQWIVGGYFETSTFDNERDFIFGDANPSPEQGTTSADGDINNRSLAAFGQVSHEVVDDLTLTAGLRYENTRATSDFTQTFTLPDNSASFPIVEIDDADITDSVLLPRLAIDYQVTPNALIFGSITRGYRPPGANFEPNDITTAVFDAETSWNYEVGLKSTWLDERLNINLTGFYNDTSNFQFPSTQDGNVIIGNADIRTIGAELEVIAQPVEGLELTAGLGLLNAEFRNGTDAFTGTDLAGNRTPYTPNLTYSLAAQYRSEIGIFGRLEVIGFGSTFFDDLNTIEQEGFALVNARLGYEFDNYGVYLSANNLFNTEYLTQAFDFGNVVGTFGAPRTFSAQVRAKF
ncbi:MAG: TonB-dependent receptor [Cyanobacteria bacterium P01_D01_bin.115]